MLSPKQGSLAGERAVKPEDAMFAGAAWPAGPGLRGLGRRGVRLSVSLDFGGREVGSRPRGERSWLQKRSAPGAHPS